MVATIDLHASRIVFGGAGGEESAPIDRGLRMAAARAAAVAVTAVTDGSGAVEAVERAGEGAGPAPASARAGQRAAGRLYRRVAARVTPPPCAAESASQLTFVR